MAIYSENLESRGTSEMHADHSNRFVCAGISRLLLQSSLPAVAAMSAQALYNVADRIFAARAVGSVGIAAVTIALPITLAITALATLFGCGAAVLISIHLGRQDREGANRVLGRTFVLLAAGGLMLTAVGLLLPRSLFRLLGAGDLVLPYTIDYSRILLLGAVFQTVGFGLNAVLRGEGNPAMAMLTMIGSVVVKVLLALLFMFAFRMGIVGAALATVGSQAVLTMWELAHFRSTKSPLRINWNDLGFDRRTFLSITAIGSPASVMQLVGVLVNGLFNYQLYATGGDLAVSASGVKYAFFLFVVMPTLGIAQGAQPIYGYNLGANRFDRVRQTLWTAVLAASTLTILGFFAAMAFPSRFVHLFHPDDSPLTAAASHAIQISMSMLPLLGFQIVGSGYFQAIGKIKQALFLTFVRQLLLLIPALLLLPRWFGLDGVWAAVPVTDALAAGLTAVLLLAESDRRQPTGRELVAQGNSEVLSLSLSALRWRRDSFLVRHALTTPSHRTCHRTSSIRAIADPIHARIELSSAERELLSASSLRRLARIHQLGIVHLMYPGAIHSRLEHSLGVLEMASRIFDVIADLTHVAPEVRDMLPELSNRESIRYWRQVLRVAALCHDVGHLPFSHAAERALIPPGWKHEHLTRSVILDDHLGRDIEAAGLCRLDVAKLAVGPRVWPEAAFSPWEKILSGIIAADAFGADRIDYLLRDPWHVGIHCPRFDARALIAALRILPAVPSHTDGGRQAKHEPSLGVLAVGLPHVEALIRARRFMFSRIFYHHARCSYEIHFCDFLRAWLPGGQYPVTVAQHVATDDVQVAAGCREAANDPRSPGHDAARRLIHRKPFPLLHQAYFDAKRGSGRSDDEIYRAAVGQFGVAQLRRDSRTLDSGSVTFPVRLATGHVVQSTAVSRPLAQQESIRMERIFIHPRLQSRALRWLAARGDVRSACREEPCYR